jgi:AcrR family transcriptional regulator
MPKAALQKVEDSKRRRIFAIAAEEFARRGFYAANVSDVAQRAGIAKGAVYLYFESKLDLYKETLRAGATMLEEAFELVLEESDELPVRLRLLYVRARAAIEEAPQLWRMYCDLVNTSDPDLVPMAVEMEAASARFYRRLVHDGRARGEVRGDLSAPILAYLLDNAFVQFFAASVSGYQAERLRMFWPEAEDAAAELARHMDEVLQFLTVGLAAPETKGRKADRPTKE